MITFRSSLIALCATLTIATGVAFAQQPPASPSPASPPAASPPVSPAQLQLARSLIVSSGISRSFDSIIPQIMAQISVNLTRTRPELNAEVKGVLDQLLPEFLKQSQEIIDNAAQIAATTMSEQELKDVVAFFNTPSGKKYVEAQPVMLDRLMVTMEAWTQKISQDMITRIRAEMKKRGKEL